MPSPLGHALGGVAAGYAAAAGTGLRLEHGGPWRTGAMFALLGMLPDADLLFGAHSGPTHGLGAAAIVGLASAVLSRQSRFGVAAAMAYASHTFLDWLGSDSSAPIGIMALWPISRAHYESSIHLFQAISRRYWMAGFVEHNLRAIAWEMLVLGPLAVLLFAIERRRSRPQP